MEKCSQVGCGNVSSFRYTWPGEDEALICEDCAIQVKRISNAIGMHLQLIPIENEEEK